MCRSRLSRAWRKARVIIYRSLVLDPSRRLCFRSDRDGTYWQAEATQLRNHVSLQVKPRLAQGEVHHLSVFGLAPQPLLMLLADLLCDISAAEVFQLHREPPAGRGQPEPNGFASQIVDPGTTDG